jgi:hypothetical protein
MTSCEDFENELLDSVCGDNDETDYEEDQEDDPEDEDDE